MTSEDSWMAQVAASHSIKWNRRVIEARPNILDFTTLFNKFIYKWSDHAMVCSHWSNANAKVWNVCYYSLSTSILGWHISDHFNCTFLRYGEKYWVSRYGYHQRKVLILVSFPLKASLRSIYICVWRLRGRLWIITSNYCQTWLPSWRKGFDVSSIVEVSMNKMALWNSVRVDV